jgi:hypothetical protein
VAWARDRHDPCFDESTSRVGTGIVCMQNPTSTGRWTAFLLLLGLALVVRASFFFDSVVDWDETTFILMGQSVLDGFVPYQDYWDLKPPFAYFAFALIDLLGLHTVVGVRVVGAVLVAATGFAVFALAARFAARGVALAVAAATILLMSGVDGGMATLTETVAMPLWMTGLVLLARTADTRRAGAVFLGGLLLSLAAMIRLNLAFAVVATTLTLLYFAYREAGWRHARSVAGWIFVGGCVPALLVVVYFALRSDLATLWGAAVEAPLVYATQQLSPWRVIARYARLTLEFPPALLVCLAAAGSVALLPRAWPTIPPAGRVAVGLALATLAGAVYSIVTGGNAYGHYVMQIVPPAALPFAAALQWLSTTRLDARWARRAVTATLGVSAAIGLYPTARHLPELAARVQSQSSLLADEGHRLTAYLVTNMRREDSLLLMAGHVAYWQTRKWPPTKILHPSVFQKAYLLPAIGGVPDNPEALMREIMSKKPTVVVAPDDLWYLDEGSPIDTVLRQALASDYELETTIDTMKVFRRVRS